MVLGRVALVFPPALMRHTAAVLPATTRHDIATRLVADLQTHGATPVCTGTQGRTALDALQRQVLTRPAQVHVLKDAPRARIAGFPGGIYVLDARVLDMAQSAEALAGALLLAEARLRMTDPVRPVLGHIGTLKTLELLTTGDVPDAALAGHAVARFRANAAPAPDPNAMLARFAALDLSTRPFVDNPDPLDPDARAVLPALRAGDPVAGRLPGRALLTDGQWVSLQNICAF